MKTSYKKLTDSDKIRASRLYKFVSGSTYTFDKSIENDWVTIFLKPRKSFLMLIIISIPLWAIVYIVAGIWTSLEELAVDFIPEFKAIKNGKEFTYYPKERE